VRTTVVMLLGLTLALVASPAVARNDVLHIPISQALASPQYASDVGDSVKFVFADRPAGYQTLGEYLASQRSHFHGRTEEGACIVNFIDALEELSDQAKSAGGNAVIGVVSAYRGVEFSSATQFECHVGSNGVFVWLKGVLARTP
jgi:uncharacterized protein YbjQ (UPF0145 family)